MTKINFDEAIDLLDEYIQTKTVHGVNGIKEKMLQICLKEFAGTEDQQDFANICSNFEKYCLITKTTSFGRKQFEVLFEQGFDVPDSMEVALKMLEPQEDPLPEIFGNSLSDDDGTDWEPCEKTHIYNNLECPYCKIQELQEEIETYKFRMKSIREMLNPWD